MHLIEMTREEALRQFGREIEERRMDNERELSQNRYRAFLSSSVASSPSASLSFVAPSAVVS